MNKEEYRFELEDIKRWLERKSEGLFENWETYDSASKYIAVSLCALVDCLIAKELHQLSQEKNRECYGREKSTSHNL